MPLPQGRVRGRHENGISVFRGIPYAAPPFGANRFKPPQAVRPTPGVLDAGEFAPAPPQAPRDWPHNTEVVGGENCLTLNIWTGADVKAGERLPVMVWIPGGGFMRGSASDPVYDGAGFARRGVVFVSLNYRLGVDGFLQLPGAPSNRGLLDQVAALAWVHANIEAFGGDPGLVTVAGSSAGAGSLACLLGVPAAQRFIRRAILQSPSVACQTPSEASHAAEVIASMLGVAATTAGIASASMADTVRVVARLAADHDLRQRHGLGARNAFPLRPCIDGELLKALPMQALQQAWNSPTAPPLELLVGANAEEMRFYLVPGGEIDRISMARVQAFAEACASGDGNEMLQAYAERLPRSTPGELLCAMQTDYYYREPARCIASMAQASGLQAHLYEFAWRSPMCSGHLGAAHSLELPFVFNTLDSPHAQAFAGKEAPRALAGRMQAAWVEFVRTGHVAGWPASGDLHMRFDDAPSVVETRPTPEALRWTYGDAGPA